MTGTTAFTGLGWLGIIRLGLVQTALGAIVVLTTSTMNRVMVVELALPAALPGALVAMHYAVQMLRPRLGYGSDLGGRRTPWIIGGMAVLATGGIGAACATALMAVSTSAGIALGIAAFLLIGLGVGASGTALLTLLATHVAPARRAPAATIVWMMMIFGFVITAASVGEALDPYSHSRLITLTAMVGCCALVVTCLAVWGIERAPLSADEAAPAEAKPGFFEALAEVWQETAARRFTVFVFASMLAYSAQDLILEPFAGIVFGMTPGESTKLASVQHSGVLMGMIMVALAGGRFGSLRVWTIGGCLASAVALSMLSLGAAIGPGFPLRVAVFALGAANGAFAVAAIGSMMGLAAAGRESREGMRMGLWGAAQAIAFGLGGFLGAASVDVTRIALGAPTSAYGLVFAGQAVLFVIAAMLAARVHAAVDKAPDAGAARAVGPAVPNLQGA